MLSFPVYQFGLCICYKHDRNGVLTSKRVPVRKTIGSEYGKTINLFKQATGLGRICSAPKLYARSIGRDSWVPNTPSLVPTYSASTWTKQEGTDHAELELAKVSKHCPHRSFSFCFARDALDIVPSVRLRYSLKCLPTSVETPRRRYDLRAHENLFSALCAQGISLRKTTERI